jgi:antitoxin PrlF
MPASTLTSKGQTTIPKKVREYLKLHPGDRLDFVIDPDGKVFVRPATSDVRELKGCLFRKGMKPVSMAEMQGALRKRFERKQ